MAGTLTIPEALGRLRSGESKLLGTNLKLDKGKATAFGLGLALAPAHESVPHGGANLCPFAVAAGCIDACLRNTGRNRMPRAIALRIARTLFYKRNPGMFSLRLTAELADAHSKAIRTGRTFAFRPNLLSDQPVIGLWAIEVLRGRDNVCGGADWRVYDYTKIPPKRWTHDPDYHRCYSWSHASTDADLAAARELGAPVAVVFDCGARRDVALPTTWRGIPVFDGDVDDWRYEQSFSVAGLRFKGSAATLAHAVAGGFAQPAVNS